MGAVQDREPPDGIVKHFTVAVFVVHRGHVLLHPHPKIGLWLPPGGHIEPHELPDDAALRETVEETGLPVRLVGSAGIPHDAPGSPRQLLRPEGIQVEDITPGHQHIDLIYFAVPLDEGAPDGSVDREAVDGSGDQAAVHGSGLPVVSGEHGMQWVGEEALSQLPVTEEIQHWVALALTEVPRRLAAEADGTAVTRGG